MYWLLLAALTLPEVITSPVRGLQSKPEVLRPGFWKLFPEGEKAWFIDMCTGMIAHVRKVTRGREEEPRPSRIPVFVLF